MNLKSFLFLIPLALTLASCSIFGGKSISKCQFKLAKFESVTLAGVDVKGAKSLKDFNMTEQAMLMKGLAQANIEVGIHAILATRNPNSKIAILNSFEWILLIDDVKITQGVTTVNKPVAADGGILEFPVRASANIMDLISRQGKNAILSYGLGLVDEEDKSDRITLKIKPTFTFGKKLIYTYPNYVIVK